MTLVDLMRRSQVNSLWNALLAHTLAVTYLRDGRGVDL